MRLDRLSTLANLLDSVPADKFGLMPGASRKPTDPRGAGARVACPLSWGTTLVEFQRQGLSLRPAFLRFEARPAFHSKEDGWAYSYRAAYREFFEIGDGQFFFLFDKDAYFGQECPRLVADRIRQFVAYREGT